jgi:hypothetical protein
MLQEKEHYLYELPDFIMGKADPKITAEIKALILSDQAFREEYELLKETIGTVHQIASLSIAAAKPDVPAGYFSTFLSRVQARVHHRREARKFRDELREMVVGWFMPLTMPEFGTALAGFAVVATLFAFAVNWNGNVKIAQPLASKMTTVQPSWAQDETDLATMSYASAIPVEAELAALSDEQVDFLLNNLDKEVPATKAIIGSDQKEIFLDDDLDALMKLL